MVSPFSFLLVLGKIFVFLNTYFSLVTGFRGDRGGDRGRYRGREDYGRLEDYGYQRSPPRRLPYRDYSPRRSPYGGRSRRERSRSYSPYERKYGGGGR